ncbi:MAG TPA: hypothetical protein VKB76_15620 [Ktedonobacterales bacterium]|nr:hypothetical protein [Ktedonobacterales bacterium]
MPFLLNKDQVTRLRLCDAGNLTNFDAAIADQASGSELGNGFEGVWHEDVIAVQSGSWLLDGEWWIVDGGSFSWVLFFGPPQQHNQRVIPTSACHPRPKRSLQR